MLELPQAAKPHAVNANLNVGVITLTGDTPPWTRPKIGGMPVADYSSGFASKRDMYLHLLTIKDARERAYGNILGDMIESNLRFKQESFADNGFVFGQERFIIGEDIPNIREILINMGFIQEFINNSGKNDFIKSNFKYHELLVSYDDKNLPRGAVMMMSAEDPTSSYDLCITYIGELTLGFEVKEKVQPYIHKRKYLPTFRVTKDIISYPDGPEVRYRDEILKNDAELSLPSFYPWLKESVGDFSRAYMVSNAPVLLLYGPTGTGKTTFLRTMAKELNAVMLTTSDTRIASNPALFESYKDMLEAAHMAGDPRPFILLIEDVDSLLFTRLAGNRDMSRLLNETKGIAANRNIRAIFTTNLTTLDQIDSALLRPGRCFGKIDFRKLSLEEAYDVRKDLGYEAIDLNHLVQDGTISLAEAIEEQHVPNVVVNDQTSVTKHRIDF